MAPKEATYGRGARTRDGFVVKNCNFFCTNLVLRTKGAFYSILDKIAYIQILSIFLIETQIFGPKLIRSFEIM